MGTRVADHRGPRPPGKVAAVPGVYYGEDRHVLGLRGRLNIPARHRRIAAEFGPKLYIMPCFDDCLMILDADGFRSLAKRIRKQPANLEEARGFERSLFGDTMLLEPDEQGRVVIPESLRRAAGLTREVLIRGANSRIELWDPERHEAYRALLPLSMAEFAKKLAI